MTNANLSPSRTEDAFNDNIYLISYLRDWLIGLFRHKVKCFNKSRWSTYVFYTNLPLAKLNLEHLISNYSNKITFCVSWMVDTYVDTSNFNKPLQLSAVQENRVAVYWNFGWHQCEVRICNPAKVCTSLWWYNLSFLCSIKKLHFIIFLQMRL